MVLAACLAAAQGVAMLHPHRPAIRLGGAPLTMATPTPNPTKSIKTTRSTSGAQFGAPLENFRVPPANAPEKQELERLLEPTPAFEHLDTGFAADDAAAAADWPDIAEAAEADAGRLEGQLLMLCVALLWGSNFPAVKAVIGGGLSGVELAGVVAERLKGKATVTLFASEAGIMPGSPPGQRDAARKTLDAAGVATRVGARATAVNEPSDSYAGGVSAAASVTYTEGDGEPTTEDYDVVCWAVGQRVESPESWPFPRDERTNKIAAEKTLRVTGHARVFAVGDVARLSDDSSSDARTGNDAYVASPPPARFDVLPATAQVAFQQADYAAWNVWSSLSSRPLLPFKYQHIGDMMVLGKTDAAVALPVGDATLDGPVAALLRRAAYLYRMPTNEHRAKLATSWLEQGAEFAAKEGPGILKSLGVPVPDFLAPNQGPNSRT